MPTLQIDVLDRRTGTTTRHTFTSAAVRIGRDPASDLCLADPMVSNAHAVLELDATGARLRDLGSKNGLHIAGRRSLPHAAIVVSRRLCVELGPFHLEILLRPGNDRPAAHGALPSSSAPDLDLLHAHLAHLHDLHAPLAAARRSFETALADALHALADDPAAARRILAEFRPEGPGSQFPAAPAHLRQPAAIPDIPLPSPPRFTPPDLTASPTSDLSPGTAHRPSFDLSPGTSLQSAPDTLALLAPLARAVLPDERPPATLDEARQFLDRLARVLRDLASGVAALQHLRVQQTRQFDLVAGGPANPILTMTRGDELLAHLLAWRAPDDAGTHELVDCFAVLLAHLRGHVHAALSTASHFAAHLAPTEIERHARARGPLRALALWRTFRERYQTAVGDHAAPVLRDTFKNAYTAELANLGVHLVPHRRP